MQQWLNKFKINIYLLLEKESYDVISQVENAPQIESETLRAGDTVCIKLSAEVLKVKQNEVAGWTAGMANVGDPQHTFTYFYMALMAIYAISGTRGAEHDTRIFYFFYLA